MDVVSAANSGYLAEEIAAKQPYSLTALRHYLVPPVNFPRAASTPNTPSPPTTTQRRKSAPAMTLKAAANMASLAKLQSVQETTDSNK